MPIYKYRCPACDGITEVIAKISDPPSHVPTVDTVVSRKRLLELHFVYLVEAGTLKGMMALLTRLLLVVGAVQRVMTETGRLLLLLACMLLFGCEASKASSTFPCGSGASVLTIGVDDPLVAIAADGLSIEEGLQGGYHIDISLAVKGSIDPDQADISLILRQGERLIARHRTDNWLLKIFDDGHCEYPEARLVFAHRDGRLFELEEVMSLLGSEVTLTATIETPQGDARGQFNLTLFELRRLDDLE